MIHDLLADQNGHTLPITEANDYFKKWNHFESTVMSDRGPITVRWNHVQKLAAMWLTQTSGYGNGDISLANFFKNFDPLMQRLWYLQQSFGVYDLPQSPVIVDVGAGAAVMDMLLHSYLPGSQFYLVDRPAWIINQDPDQVRSLDNLCWKHDWSVVEDAIDASGFDRDRFVFLDPTHDWKFESDLIMSSMAWGMHFHITEYLQRCLHSLKLGGKLLLDINAHWFRSITQQLDEELGCQHTVIFSSSSRMINLDYAATVDRLRMHFPDAEFNSSKRVADVVYSKCLWTRYR